MYTYPGSIFQKQSRRWLIAVGVCLMVLQGQSQQTQIANQPSREQWFQDMGFGMFIHWGVDVSLGSVISHSLAGSSPEYATKYFKELPAQFNPKKFEPEEWAALAKLAGMKYMVFTTKHHSGFCMWPTKTTGFNVAETPYGKDITKAIVEAFRKQGIAIGFYFSPEDFHYLYEQKIPIGRIQHPMHFPANNKGLMDLDKAQLKELLTGYGKIDLLFLDGPAEGLKEYAWQLQPEIVVTRGQMKTPEQNLPDKPIPGPWEACFTMGTDWQYKPTNDPQKSGTEMINMLIETRAKGGNLLLNIGPKPNGEIQIEQEALLRELALWNFVNEESVHAVRPFSIIKEGPVWFARSAKDSNTVYAFVPGGNQWPYGDRKELVFRQIKPSNATHVSILGYDSQLLEYKEGFDASLRFQDTNAGFLISAVNGHRLYTNNKWPNPVVIKMKGVQFKPLTESKTTKSKIDGAL
jgi:alpha-L-fucosidase